MASFERPTPNEETNQDAKARREFIRSHTAAALFTR
jgi:hypothetical protein